MVQKNTLNKLLIICGATATGKSDLAVECAKILDSEVISADSMNVYKGLNIGTAKPSEEEKQGIVHHLIDVVSPYERYTVGDYRAQALPILKNLLERGKIPVICGGTGFYINSLLIQDLHKLFAGDGLFLIQELCKLVELRAVLLQNPHRLRVLLLHKVNHLSVDLCLRFGAARQ